MQDGEEEMFWEYDSGVDALVHPVANAVLTIFPFIKYFPGHLRSGHQRLLKAKALIKERYVDRQKVNVYFATCFHFFSLV